MARLRLALLTALLISPAMADQPQHPAWGQSGGRHNLEAGPTTSTTVDLFAAPMTVGSPTIGTPAGSVSGAPGPIAGAGLPVLAIGYGVYWLVRRRRSL